MLNADFWSAQRVLLTGHTGFKGSRLSLWLEKLGAETFGFALPSDQTPSLYANIEPAVRLHSIIGEPMRHLVEEQIARFEALP
jgi:CDP-glucose 4,6-dehydratase